MAVDHNELAARVGDLLQRGLAPARACALLKDRANGASSNDMQLAMWIALRDQAEQIVELEREVDELHHQEHEFEDLSLENEKLVRELNKLQSTCAFLQCCKNDLVHENNKLPGTLDEFLRCHAGKAAP